MVSKAILALDSSRDEMAQKAWGPNALTLERRSNAALKGKTDDEIDK